MPREQLLPTGRMYRALRNQHRTFGTALAEWVENSLGENRGNANRVWIIFGDRAVAILDDGRGPEKLGDVIQIGAGAISGGFDSGRFGWGGSIAQVTFARRSEMWALRDDGLSAHDTVNWDRIVERAEHPAVDSSWSYRKVPIELVNLGHGFLLNMEIQKGKHIQSKAAQKHIAREFAPAIRAGKRIYWVEGGETTEIQAWEPSDLQDIVRAMLLIGPGLQVELEAGWSDTLSPKEQGLEFEYGPRRLGRTKVPFEGYSGKTIFGWLRLLGDGWLEFFESEKTGIASDELRSAIEEKARQVLTPLMDELRALQRNTALVAIGEEFAAALNKIGRSRGKESGGFPDTADWRVRGGTRKKRNGPAPDEAHGPGQRTIFIDGDDALGSYPFTVDAPVSGDWQIILNDKVPAIRRALEETPPNRPALHQVLAMAIAFELVANATVIRLGIFDANEWEEIADAGEVGLVPAVYQRLLEAIST